jgi:hypothetical protein
MFIPNRHSRRKQYKLSPKNNSKSTKQLPVTGPLQIELAMINRQPDGVAVH